MSNLVKTVTNGMGFVTIERRVDLRNGIMSYVPPRVRKQLSMQKFDNDQDFIRSVQEKHPDVLNKNTDLRIFIFVEAYNQIYSLFDFHADALCLPLHVVLDIYENGIQENALIRDYLFSEKQSLIPNLFLLAIINGNKGVEFEHSYRAYHILSRYLLHEDPIELRLCTSEDEVKLLVHYLARQGMIEIIGGIPVPTNVPKNKTASKYISFPVPSFAAFRAFKRDCDNDTIAQVIPRPSKILTNQIKRSDICIKLQDFYFATQQMVFHTHSKSGVPQTRVDEKLVRFVESSRKSSGAKSDNEPTRFVLILKNADEEARLSEFQHCHYGHLNRLQSVVLWLLQCTTKVSANNYEAIAKYLIDYTFAYCVASELSQ